MDCKKELKKKLSESYERLVKQWMASTPAQLVAAAEEIAAAHFIHDSLTDAITEGDAAFLLRYEDPLAVMRDKWIEENGAMMVHNDGLAHCIASLSAQQMAGADMELVVEHIYDTKGLGGNYPLVEGLEMGSENEASAMLDGIIDRASEEQEEYLASLSLMSPAEIIERSAETDALNRLLSDLVHDSYDLEYEDLCCLAQEDRPLHALYEFVRGQEEPFDLDAITPILKAFNEEYASGQVQEGVTLC